MKRLAQNCDFHSLHVSLAAPLFFTFCCGDREHIWQRTEQSTDSTSYPVKLKCTLSIGLPKAKLQHGSVAVMKVVLLINITEHYL